MFNCEICSVFSSKTNRGLSQHVRFAHNMLSKNYRIKYCGRTFVCKGCNKNLNTENNHDYCFSCYSKSNLKKEVSFSNAIKHRTYKGSENPNYKGLAKIKCKCGKGFEVTQARKHTAKYCSNKCRAHYSISISKHTLYKGNKLRSSWELEFAKWMDKQGLTWQYEPTSIKLKYCSYRPDFWVEDWNCFVEVKGFFRKDAQEKFNEASQSHKIKLVDRQWFLNHGYRVSSRKGLLLCHQ